MPNELEKPPVLPTKGGFSKKVGVSAQRQQAAEKLAAFDPLSVPNRIAIEFDDSASMAGQRIIDAKDAIDNFLQSCNQSDTAIMLQPMNSDTGANKLTNMYSVIAITKETIRAGNGTPLFRTMKQLLAEPITRAIIFSDGEAGDGPHVIMTEGVTSDDETGAGESSDIRYEFKRKNIPCDCVAIGTDSETLKEIAEITGGIYMKFEKGSSLASGLKYLSPGYRALLANAEIKAKVERGEEV